MNFDHVTLPDTNGAPDRLVHERLRPPRTREEDAIEMLQVQTDSAGLKLHQKNLVARLVRPVDDVGLLLGVELSAINLRAVSDELLQHVHFGVEVAEYDPATVTNETLDRVELRRASNPVGALVKCAEGLLSRANVYLRVQAQLPEAHEKLQSRDHAVRFERVPALLDDAIHALVELGLIVCREVEAVRMIHGLRRRAWHCRAELVHGASQHGVFHRGRRANHGQQRFDVLRAVHDRGRRKKPFGGGNRRFCNRRGFVVGGEPMRLVVDDAVPL